MMKGSKFLLLLFHFSLQIINLQAQFSGSNLLESQYGRLPSDTNSIATVYDRAVLNYSYKKIKTGLTLEQFHSKNNGSSYIKPDQFSLQYSSDRFELKAGNFYETIGRGLLLRSYEIQGAIIEDLSYRSRHYFHRDILGLSSKLKLKNFNLGLISGRTLNNVFPPTFSKDDRRVDMITAVYSDYSFNKQTVKASVLQLKNTGSTSYYGMLSVSGILLPFLSYYTELAKNVSDFRIMDFSGKSSYAFYSGLNLIFANLGLSAEYKNYKNFLIGTGINEPPSLVKEHTYKVLNRSTHVLQPLNETGYQLEIFYNFPDLSKLTLNNTIAVNDFNKKFVFQEYFAGYDFQAGGNHDTKLFADFARDPFKGEENRLSAGLAVELVLRESSNIIKTGYEFQTFTRYDEPVQNHVISAGYLFKSKFAFILTTELSNDPFLTDEKFIVWPGTDIRYQINNKNTVQLCAGRRRGGPACNAGICYEVLDFYGIELRLKSRF